MHEERNERARAMWSAGDYAPTSRQLEPASERLVAALGIGGSHRVLDVAAGHGNCALAAARRGAAVVATDYSPAMLATGRARTQRAGRDVTWLEGDATDLPFDDDRFDRVTSVFGAVFAPDQAVVAAEMTRVVRPGGAVGLTAWTADDMQRRMRRSTGDLLPAGHDGGPDHLAWGDPAHVRELFAPLECDVATRHRTLRFRFPSWSAWRHAVEVHGMSVSWRKTMAPDVWTELHDRMQAVTAEFNIGRGGQVVFDSAYLEIVASPR